MQDPICEHKTDASASEYEIPPSVAMATSRAKTPYNPCRATFIPQYFGAQKGLLALPPW